MGQVLDQTLTADGNSETFTLNGTKASIQSSGGYGGGTLNLEVSFDGGTTFQVDAGFATTALNTGANFAHVAREVALGLNYRFVVAGSTTPTLRLIVVQGGS